MTVDIFTFKRGDTFRLTGSTPRSLAGVALACHVRKGEQLVSALAVEITAISDTASSFKLTDTNGTYDWPPGQLAADLKLVMPDGAVRTTNTFYINVIDTQTRL